MRSWLIRFVRENKSFLLFLALMSVFRSAVADWNEVPTGSMQPTIVEGDRILVNKLAYDIRLPFTLVSLVRLSDPARGDIVVFDSEAADKRLVKRVIGLPGDRVALRGNALTINGSPVAYAPFHDAGVSRDKIEYLPGADHLIRVAKYESRQSSFATARVPEGHYLVLGDNRDNSADSRSIGFIPRHEIVGRARHVVMSLNYDNFYLPRKDRFLRVL